MAYVDPATGAEEVFLGRCTGILTDDPRGTNGFGYDPAFVPDEHPDRTMAQLSPQEKGAISHRGRAVALLRAFLEESG
jgi:XTP/dITP diphosphohydrolase